MCVSCSRFSLTQNMFNLTPRVFSLWISFHPRLSLPGIVTLVNATWKPRFQDSWGPFALMIGDTLKFKDGQVGNTEHTEDRPGVLCFGRRALDVSAQVWNTVGRSAKWPPGGSAPGRETGSSEKTPQCGNCSLL